MKKQKKRIAVIGLKGIPAFGGAAAVGENIINQLKHEFDFTVYATSSHTHLKSGLYNGIQLVVFRKIFPGSINVLYYYILSSFHSLFKSFDLIHLNHSTAAFILFILRLKYKVVSTSHGLKTDNKWKYLKMYIRLQAKILLKYSTEITTVSKIEYDEYCDEFSNIHYIPNGVNIVNDIPSVPEKEEYILFMAGRIIPIKGCHLFLKALKEIGAKEKILIVGDLDQMLSYKKEITELAKDLNVQFLDIIKDKKLVYSYLSNAKLFIFPSLYENMSMMLLEAVSVKTNMISSNIPQNTTIFSDDEMLFFESNNYQDLSEKIKYAFCNPEEMKQRQLKSYDKVVNKYSWEHVAKEYRKLYIKLIC